MKTITVVVILIIVVSIVICCISSIISYYYLIKPTSTSTPISTPIPTKSTKQTKIMMYKNLVDDDVYKLYKEYVRLKLIQKKIQWTDKDYETLRIFIGLFSFLMNKYPNKDTIDDDEFNKLIKDISIEPDDTSESDEELGEFFFTFTLKVVGKKDTIMPTKDKMISNITAMINSIQKNKK